MYTLCICPIFNPVARFLINEKNIGVYFYQNKQFSLQRFSKCDLICFPTLACHYLDDRFIEPKGDIHYSAKY